MAYRIIEGVEKTNTNLARRAALNVSIVIPVYNEADSLAACLDAIAQQTVKPFEVIVVDNNSTDETLAVLTHFPFVTALGEDRQGVVFARDRGFNAAHGNIIGRIDADTLVSPDWVASIQHIFEDPTVAATSGRVVYGDIVGGSIINPVEASVRGWLARRMHKAMFLQGANMALRRSSWLQVRHAVCREGDIHEDFDLALHLRPYGKRVTYEPDLKVTISARRLGSGFWSFCVYAWLNPRTYALHRVWQRVYMYPVIVFVILAYGLLGALYKAYDPETGRFAPKRLLDSDLEPRVNPATFRD